MGSVEVIPISLPRETVRFVKTWFKIYENDPHWVPPLYFERKRFFDPRRNPYFKVAQVQCFVAVRDGRDVGTIAATVDEAYQADSPGTGFFGFFEFIEDVEVAGALLDRARDWLADRGMETAVGPFNFNSNHEFALLVDGFDSDPYIANPHNSAYYPEIYEAVGLRPVMDWYAYHVDSRMKGVKRMQRVCDRLLSRHPEIVIRPIDMARFDEEVEAVREIYRDAWEKNWGHVRVSDEEFVFIAAGLKEVLDPDLCLIAEVGGRTAAISVTLPDMNQVVKKMKGRILPFGWRHLLRKKKIIDRVRVFMLGVSPEFQSLPLGAALYARSFEVGESKGLGQGEASLILENNVRMRGALEKMGATIEKTYRSYEIGTRRDPTPPTNEGERI
ncbi:MAG TPA: N-acetyltransferase [Deltaproteobacteria bacterium]|nr:N-acetyltransferase [Deltaproteobacteria bacterium]